MSKALVLACLTAALVLAGGAAKASARTADVCPGCPEVAIPQATSDNAKALAKAAFHQKFSDVWNYIEPTMQKAISQSHWLACNTAKPPAPKSVTIQRTAIASSTSVPTVLPLLGKKTVQEVQVRVTFVTPASPSSQFAVEYTFWVQEKSKWYAVWLQDEFNTLKAGKCYLTPQGPELY